MLCKIAELITEVPEAGGLAPRCQAYLWDEHEKTQIRIDPAYYMPEIYPEGTEEALIEYIESGRQFYCSLIYYNGLMLHASAVVADGKAYLFSGNSGAGKSTHTGLWKKILDEAVEIINDDKPALRCLDGKWFAYGTPWCGKDGININKKVPLAGICFLEQADHNEIRRLTPREALVRLIPQIPLRYQEKENLRIAMSILDKLITQIPVFELKNRPEPEAARLSYTTMRKAAEEANL